MSSNSGQNWSKGLRAQIRVKRGLRGLKCSNRGSKGTKGLKEGLKGD